MNSLVWLISKRIYSMTKYIFFFWLIGRRNSQFFGSILILILIRSTPLTTVSVTRRLSFLSLWTMSTLNQWWGNNRSFRELPFNNIFLEYILAWRNEDLEKFSHLGSNPSTERFQPIFHRAFMGERILVMRK